MLFRDRLEIWNPGSLTLGWTIEKLKQLHSSVPANPLMAEPLFLTAYIERLGTGTSDMVTKSIAAGLKEPQFIQAEEFRTVLYRPSHLQISERVPDKYLTSNEELPQEYRSTSVEVRNLIAVLENEMNRQELQDKLELKHEGNFRNIYLIPALYQGLISMTHPEIPNHPDQRYKLSELGLELKKHLDQYAEHKIAPQDTRHVTPQVEQLVMIINGDMNRDELQNLLGLKDRENFRRLYIVEALNSDLIEMTIPGKPKSKNQKYRLTEKGLALQKLLKDEK